MSTQPLDHAFEASILSNSQYRRFCELPACRQLSDEEMMQLFSSLESRCISAGSVVYEAESLSDQTIYLITDGCASVSRPGHNIYAQLHAGDHFGLYSFLDDERQHAATIKAVTDLELLTMNRAYFDLITLEEPQLGNQILRFMFHLLSGKTLEVRCEYASMHEFETAGDD